MKNPFPALIKATESFQPEWYFNGEYFYRVRFKNESPLAVPSKHDALQEWKRSGYEYPLDLCTAGMIQMLYAKDELDSKITARSFFTSWLKKEVGMENVSGIPDTLKILDNALTITDYNILPTNFNVYKPNLYTDKLILSHLSEFFETMAKHPDNKWLGEFMLHYEKCGAIIE